MRFDKFGAIAIVLGVALLLGMFYFGFAQADGWTTTALWSAIIVLIEGTILLAGLAGIILGIMLIVL